MDEETKEILIFAMEAIEKLSIGLLTDKYDNDEIYEIYNQAIIHLHSLQ